MRKIAIVGLGYVGLPVAIALSRVNEVIGFDISEERISELKNGYDRTHEITTEQLRNSTIHYTKHPELLAEVEYIIVAVPTPIDKYMKPNLQPIKDATEMIAGQLKANTTVIYESTVYPGLTEEVCLPILEKASGLIAGKDFSIGYSPERINPGDKKHTFTTIKKVVAGLTHETTDDLAEIYSEVIEAGVYKAKSIKVAEAAKIIENIQRDVNIALMNELSMIFNKLDIDTNEVLSAALTKWNFLNFKPGLVGGHCIGVDPYYLTYKAQEIGFHPEIILAGRRLNDSFDKYISSEIIKQFIKYDKKIPGAVITILGATFKENVPDIRNSKIFNLIKELESYGMTVQLHDIHANSEEVATFHNYKLVNFKDLKKVSAVLLAVPHLEYIENTDLILKDIFNDDKHLLFFDLKGAMPAELIPQGAKVWKL